jgi:predicted alpha/beta hydrolase family esterase
LKKDKTPFALRLVRWLFPKLEMLSPTMAHRLFIKIFFTPLTYSAPPKEIIIRNKASRFQVIIDGKKIQCYQWGGDGPVILLVHGWAGRPTQFRKFIEKFVDLRYRVVGFDGPAHGASDGTRTNIREFANVLEKIYDVTREPEAIITHSFGGSAVLYAAVQGLPVKKLVNIASPTIGDEIINTYLRAINGSSQTGEFFKSYILKTQGKPFEEFTSLFFIRNIQQPLQLLLVHDENDRDVYIRHAEELIKVYPQARLFRTKGLGHTRILKNERVIDECVTFIRGIRL